MSRGRLRSVAWASESLRSPRLRRSRVVVGAEARRPAVQLFTRGLGVRDVVLGAGALVALRTGDPARRWILAGALADAGDTFAIAATGDIRSVVRVAGSAFAGGAAALGLGLARRLA